MMLKSQLEDKLTTIFKIEQELSQKIVFSIVESISTAINENDRVEIRGLVVFLKKTTVLIKEEIQKLEKVLWFLKKASLYLDRVKI